MIRSHRYTQPRSVVRAMWSLFSVPNNITNTPPRLEVSDLIFVQQRLELLRRNRFGQKISRL